MSLAALGLVAIATAAPTGASTGPATPPLERFGGETFVGATSSPDLFVAVVVGEGATEGRAYLCDGTGVSEWLAGTVDGSVVELVSTSGASLEASVAASGVTGTATLPDGSTVSFDAAPAEGVGGLYTSEFAPDGRVRGVSSSGATLDGVVAARPISVGGESVFPLVGFITPVDAEPVAFAVTLTGANEPDQTRSITLNDGQQRGRSRLPGRVWVTDPMAMSIRDGTSN